MPVSCALSLGAEKLAIKNIPDEENVTLARRGGGIGVWLLSTSIVVLEVYFAA